MKKVININKLSEIFLSLDSDIGSDYSYYSEYINNIGHNKNYLINLFKEEENATVEDIIEDFVNTSNKLILEEKEENNKLKEQLKELIKYKEYINKKGFNSDFNDYIKEKEKLEIPF